MLSALAILAALPLLLGIALWLGQERLIFFPDAREITAPPGWDRVTVRSPDGTDLAALVARGAPDRPILLHFHGNGGNAGDRTDLSYILRNAGYTVVLAEYRGYGGTPGRPGEAAFATDAAAILAWLRQTFPDAKLVLWGESLGTAVVTRLAAGREDIAGLILESPFTSVADLAAATYPWLPARLLLRHRFESLAHLPAIAAPILLVASAEDRLTPPDHARRMAAAAPRAQLLMLPGAAHPAVLNDPSGAAIRAVVGFVGRLN
ncbi:alpha/beta hydrolase [Roseomonas sp. HJA6]|uniref:Alpha/beta hydrolase n=1 Tax=Roseomonas alba TaxID=2846776 RepID=A0ABS7A599_9PROT|nr:alpha/beta fold hydrolase [Neoroseomonas alba]MBW6397453.1 alpha/beta hydrolase [Neoroseomonas alba]